MRPEFLDSSKIHNININLPQQTTTTPTPTNPYASLYAECAKVISHYNTYVTGRLVICFINCVCSENRAQQGNIENVTVLRMLIHSFESPTWSANDVSNHKPFPACVLRLLDHANDL